MCRCTSCQWEHSEISIFWTLSDNMLFFPIIIELELPLNKEGGLEPSPPSPHEKPSNAHAEYPGIHVLSVFIQLIVGVTNSDSVFIWWRTGRWRFACRHHLLLNQHFNAGAPIVVLTSGRSAAVQAVGESAGWHLFVNCQSHDMACE